MNSILFIYIFSLFVITSPNFIFKIPVRSYWISIAIHAVIFSCILYFTYDIVNRDVVESAVVNNGSDQDDGTASVGGTGGTGTGTAGGNETIIIESSDSGTDSEGVQKNAANIMKLKEQQNQTVLDNANDIVNLANTYADNAAIYADTAYHAANQINGASTASPATHTTSGTTGGSTSGTTGGSTNTHDSTLETPSEIQMWMNSSVIYIIGKGAPGSTLEISEELPFNNILPSNANAIANANGDFQASIIGSNNSTLFNQILQASVSGYKVRAEKDGKSSSMITFNATNFNNCYFNNTAQQNANDMASFSSSLSAANEYCVNTLGFPANNSLPKSYPSGTTPTTLTTSGAATRTTSGTTGGSISGTTGGSTTSEVTFWFKTSTGGGIQLSEITFYDDSGNQLSVVSTEKPSTNNDGTSNTINLKNGQREGIEKTYDNNTSTKWYDGNRNLGSVKYTVNGIPSSYTFTTANDNNPHNRTPVTWTAYFNTHVNTEIHTSEEYYTSATQQNYFTLPADGTKFSLQGGSL